MGGEAYVGDHDARGSGTYDRLVRIGARYNATSPNVSDGDDVYVLLDTSGRMIVSGAVAHGGVATGFPVRTGGVYRTTLPAVTAGNIADLLVSAEGRLRIEEYKVQQTRIGNHKYTFLGTGAAGGSAGELTAASWTVTSATTGFLAAAYVSLNIETTTDCLVRFYNDTTIFYRVRHGTGQHDVALQFPVVHKLAGNGTKVFKITIDSGSGTTQIQSLLVGWEE